MGASTAALSTASKRAARHTDKALRKRLNLKPGGEWEALALLDALHKLYEQFAHVYGER
jgi:hypothetical protein